MRNIRAGFHGTGISPFYPSKVLDRIVITIENSIEIRPATPVKSTTPFSDAVLTSSPIDIDVVHAANVALHAQIMSEIFRLQPKIISLS